MSHLEEAQDTLERLHLPDGLGMEEVAGERDLAFSAQAAAPRKRPVSGRKLMDGLFQFL